MSNTRKLDLAKLARVLAADMVKQSTTRPSVTVTPGLADALEARGWERGHEFKVAELRPGQVVRLKASGVLSETVEPTLTTTEPESSR